MKKNSKRTIVTWFSAGLLFALAMAGFDYLDGNVFNIWKFIFHFLGYGLIMSLIIGFAVKKTTRKS
jgi:hypothetical protein